MEELLQEQMKTYERLKKLHKNFKKNPCLNKGDVSARMDLILKYYNQFCEKDDIIEKTITRHELDKNNENYFKDDISFQFELLFVSMKAELLETKFNESASSAPVESSSSVQKEVKDEKKNPIEDSPQINLRKFSGDPIDWLEFRREYYELVKARNDLTVLQKCDILKSALPAELYDSINHLCCSGSEDDFEKALKKLYHMFTKRTLMGAYLDKIIQLPGVNSSSKNIHQFLHNTITYMLGLLTLNIDISNWDSLLIHILVRKLNEKTKTEWYDTFPSQQEPSIYEFLTFLNSKHLKTDLSDEIEKFNNTADRNALQSICACCQLKHSIWQCDKFEALNIDEKLLFMKDKKICRRCLSSKHVIKECQKSYRCRICQSRDHHYLLHKNPKP